MRDRHREMNGNRTEKKVRGVRKKMRNEINMERKQGKDRE